MVQLWVETFPCFEERSNQMCGRSEGDGCAPGRWSDDEARSLPGQVFNAEAASTATSRNIARYLGGGQLLAIAWAYLKGAERTRGDNFVRVDGEWVVIGNGGEVRVLPLSDCVRVERDTDARSRSAMLTIVLTDGQRVPLPDSLYPDARGMFPSKRHADLLTEIESRIRACIAANGQDPGRHRAGDPSA